MPQAPKQPCNTPGCPNLKPCAQHKPKWRTSSVPRQRGRKLQAARRRLFQDKPLCEHCKAQGRIAAATDRDHIVPLFKGGADNDSNTQALCKTCHDRKTDDDLGRRTKWTVQGIDLL